MEIFKHIFGGASGKIKELESDNQELTRKLESMTNSRNYFKGERDSCLELVKEAGAKEEAYNAAIADYDRVVARCSELEAERMAAIDAAQAFAEEFEIELPDVAETDEAASGADAADPTD